MYVSLLASRTANDFFIRKQVLRKRKTTVIGVIFGRYTPAKPLRRSTHRHWAPHGPPSPT